MWAAVMLQSYCSMDVPQGKDSESLFAPAAFDEQGLEQISLGP